MNRGLLGVVLIAFLAPGSLAQAASRPPVTIALQTTLRHSANYPNSGSSAVYAGTVRTNKLGRGVIVQTLTITAHPSPAVFTFRGTSTAYYSHGTAKSSFTGTGKLQPGGRFTLSGQGHYTGGSLYRHARTKYSFTGTAPPPPSPAPPPPCAVPAGWKTVAADANVVVIVGQPDYPIQEYRYCDYSAPSRGFQLLVRNDDGRLLGGAATLSTVDGVAQSYILYHSTDVVDSPGCGGPQPTHGFSTVYALNTTSGNTVTLAQGAGGITSAQFSPAGVGAWILTSDQCPLAGGNGRTETLGSYSVRTGGVTTLDTGDPGETLSSPSSLANLQLYQCVSPCPANTVVVAWTHDGTWRYEQES